MSRFIKGYGIILIVPLIFLTVLPALGIISKADSLKSEFNSADITIKAKILNELARHYWYSSFDSSIKYGTAALDLATSRQLVVEMVNAYNNLGVAYDMRGEYSKAMSFYFQIVKTIQGLGLYTSEQPLELFFSTKTDLASEKKNWSTIPSNNIMGMSLSQEEEKMLLTLLGKGLSNLGILYGRLSHYNKSLICFRESIAVRKQVNDKEGIAVVLTNLGTMYIKMNNTQSAAQSLREAISILKTTNGDPSRLAGAQQSMGELQIITGKLDSALLNLSAASETYIRIKNNMGLSYVKIQFGKLYLHQKNYSKAIDAFHNALEILVSLKDRENEGLVYKLLGDANTKLGKFENAVKQYQLALNVGRLYGYKAIEADALLGLTHLYESKSLPSAALAYYKEYMQVNSWLLNQKFNANLSQQQVLFEFEQIEKENILLKSENELKKVSLKRQRDLKLLFLAILFIFLLFGLILYFLYRKLLRANEKLRSLNLGLEEKVNVRTNELRETLKIAEEGNRIKNAFLTNLSHEIRTPLNGIIGFTSLLERSFSETDYESKYIKEIKVSSDRLMGFLNDLIDLSQAESNKLKVKYVHCNLQALVSKVAERFKKEIDEKGLSLHTSFDQFPEVITDSENIQRILTVVLSNAVKYTDKGSISFSIAFKEFDSSVEFAITDTGIGIDSDYLPHIFEPFQQESTGLSRLYQGAGLGLALAKRLVNLMNGSIEVNSRKGAGTIVFIKIPVSFVAETHTKGRAKLTTRNIGRNLGPRPKKAKVLIIEENTYTRFFLQSMLKKHFNVFVARDGNEALSIVDDTNNVASLFDIVIADIGMKEPWNLQNFVSEVYKRKPEYSKRVIAVQGEKETEGALLEGPEGLFWIQKPIEKVKILDVLFESQKLKRSRL